MITANDRAEISPYVRCMATTDHLLSSVEVARFVANGFHRMDAVVPPELNDEAVGVFDAGVPVEYLGEPVPKVFAEGSFTRRLLDVPAVAGALRSLVGPDPLVDHQALHVREPHEGRRSRSTATRSSTPARTRSTSSSCTTRTRSPGPWAGPCRCPARTCAAPTSPTPAATRTCAGRRG
nr:hypothetical protein GCM10025732_39130 [Glycomyces mayteni]